MDRPRGKRPPGVHRHGTAAQLAAHDKGYSGDGTGEWSRHAAHRYKPTPRNVAAIGEVDQGRSAAELIRDEQRALGKLVEKLEHFGPGDAQAKVLKSISIKERFLIRLKQEQQAEH